MFGSSTNETTKLPGETVTKSLAAARPRIHPTYISQLERGLKSPSPEVVAALAKALGRKPYELIRAAEDGSR